MATLEISFAHDQLEARKRRLQQAITLAPQNTALAALLREVDLALERMASGTYGICESCHDTIEQQRLLSDPLVRYCLDHLSGPQLEALQRDLDLAAQVQRNLLPQCDLRAGAWHTSYHYEPLGAVSGDYCDLIPSDGQLFFALGDVSGKGVAASLLMAQLHTLFRTLTAMNLSLGQIVTQANRVFCEAALAGQYATLVVGMAKPTGEVEIHNAGHLPAIVVGKGGVLRIESTGLPLGMFCEVEFCGTRLQTEPGDTLFLYTDGLSEARGANGDQTDEDYGVDRIVKFLRQNAIQPPAGLISACLDDLRAFGAGTAPFDDLTVLAIQRAPAVPHPQ
ncbi:MAG TPA: SpoIIE family protein phosphatase [Terriglobales bacterium]